MVGAFILLWRRKYGTVIRKAKDKSENRTAGSPYTIYMGGTSTGKSVTERRAMQMTVVYSYGF